MENLAKEIYDHMVQIGVPVGDEGWKGHIKGNRPYGEMHSAAYYQGGKLWLGGIGEMKIELLDDVRKKFADKIKKFEILGYDNGLYMTIGLRTL